MRQRSTPAIMLVGVLLKITLKNKYKMQTLVIDGTQFELPPYCDIQYEKSTKTTHIYFDMGKEKEYTDFVNKVTSELKIPRFGHSLGIVFSYCHIFWDGKVPPNGVSVIWKTKDGTKIVKTWGI
jgi:hypothetical protein